MIATVDQLLSGSTGVEISGIELSVAPDGQIEDIRRLVSEYCVAIFPGQHLHPTDHVTFARRFGPLLWTPGEDENTEWPDILQFRNEGQSLHRTGLFHTDTCFIAEPPSFTLLSSVEAPDPVWHTRPFGCIPSPTVARCSPPPRPATLPSRE